MQNRSVAVTMSAEQAPELKPASYVAAPSTPTTTMGSHSTTSSTMKPTSTTTTSRTSLRTTRQGSTPQAYVEPPPPIPGTQASSKPNVEQLLIVLKHSVHPEQRKWAAESLSRPDCSSSTEVVQTLLNAAGRDPSNEVRVSCIRALVKMNVKTVPVVTALKAISGDPSSDVEREAKLALTQLGTEQVNSGATELPLLVDPQPHGHVATSSATARPGMFIQGQH